MILALISRAVFAEEAWLLDPSPLRCLETVMAYLQDPSKHVLPPNIHPFQYEISSIQNLAIISKTVNATNRSDSALIVHRLSLLLYLLLFACFHLDPCPASDWVGNVFNSLQLRLLTPSF